MIDVTDWGRLPKNGYYVINGVRKNSLREVKEFLETTEFRTLFQFHESTKGYEHIPFDLYITTVERLKNV